MKDVFGRLCLFGIGIIYGWHALWALRSGKVTTNASALVGIFRERQIQPPSGS